MENTIVELKFSLDTFYFLMSGVLVMWMAAGFAMLEAGLVRAKNTTEILTIVKLSYNSFIKANVLATNTSIKSVNQDKLG